MCTSVLTSHIIMNMIADFHNDFLTGGNGDLQKLSQSTVCAVCAVFRGARTYAEIVRIVKGFLKKRPKNLYLGLEDIGYADESNLDEVCSWRPVYASLTWNGRNELAGGCMAEGGLTERGRMVVRRLAEEHILLDCAHLNRQSFREALDLGARPVDSHTCMNSVWRHLRNLDDWQIKEIADRDGLVGIAFVEKFLCGGRATAETVFRHADYAVQKFGNGRFCFGTDYYGADRFPCGLDGYGGEEILIDCFLRHGYARSDINKIFAKNLQNFLSKKVF